MKPLKISSLILFWSLWIAGGIFAAGNYELTASNSEELRLSIPTIRPSDINTILQDKKAKTPTILNKQLAEFGNNLLKSKGVNFTFSWDPKGKRNEANLRKADYNKLTPFFYQFTKMNGKLIEFRLLARDFAHP